MTREEAIDIIKCLAWHTRPDEEDVEQAIKALEQQPCEDCISRQAVLETIETCNSDGLKGIFCSYDDGKRFEAYIKYLPPVTPKGKTGHWIERKLPMMIHDWKCDQCRMVTNERTNYCPNCGARMVEQ